MELVVLRKELLHHGLWIVGRLVGHWYENDFFFVVHKRFASAKSDASGSTGDDVVCAEEIELPCVWALIT